MVTLSEPCDLVEQHLHFNGSPLSTSDVCLGPLTSSTMGLLRGKDQVTHLICTRVLTLVLSCCVCEGVKRTAGGHAEDPQTSRETV